MNLANKLTLLRIFLVPIFLIFFMVHIPYGTIIATIIFILASVTDKLDGHIARSRNQVTKFGKLMDPLADKLLVTSALISLVELKVIPGVIAIIIIARELAVTSLRSIAASEGIVLAASKWGKLKTFIQIVAIILCLLEVNIHDVYNITNLELQYPVLSKAYTIVKYIALTLTVIVTLISGIDYFVKNKNVLVSDK